MSLKIKSLFLILLISSISWSQKEEQEFDRVITVDEWIKEIENSEKSSAHFANVNIVHNDEMNFSEMIKNDLIMVVDIYGNLLTDYTIKTDKKISLVNCKLPPAFRLVNSRMGSFFASNTDFGNSFLLKNSIVSGDFSINSWGQNPITVTLEDVTIKGHVQLSGTFNDVSYQKGIFKYDTLLSDSYKIERFTRQHVRFTGEYKSIQLIDCNISGSEKIEKMNSVTVANVQLGDFILSGDTMHSINMKNLSVGNSLKFENTLIKEHILPINIQLISENTNIPWFQLKGSKIGISHDSIIYKGLTLEECGEIYDYGDLLSVYNKFYEIYKSRGDKESMNGCYFEMKQIEGRRLEFIHRTKGSMTSWFNWRLNQFLLLFCDYGTNPVKSLIFSIYVIIAFAGLYFFFYSDWDRISRSFLIKQHTMMMQYFSSDQTLEDFHTQNYRDELKSFENFKKHLEESKKVMPLYMTFLGKPLYLLSVLKFKFVSWFYRRLEILSGKWIDLSNVQKIVRGTVIGISILGYLTYLFVVRSLNSIVLSLNTFSTLGFGDIPVRGISRYVAVIEGFLGWFLLSIFSVSLISQILQG